MNEQQKDLPSNNLSNNNNRPSKVQRKAQVNCVALLFELNLLFINIYINNYCCYYYSQNKKEASKMGKGKAINTDRLTTAKHHYSVSAL